MGSRTRKIYFIEKNFQTRFILRFVIVTTIWAILAALLFGYLAKSRLEEVRYSSYIDIKSTSGLLLPITVGTHIVSLLIFAVILAFTIQLLFKRLSGPLGDIKRDIAKIAGGDLSGQIILRTNDEFQDLAADLDVMRTEVQKKIIRIKQKQQVLSVAVQDLNLSIVNGKASPALTEPLQSALARIKEEVQTFIYS